eukprot:TRINITY_DN1238_c0_g1_i1.p1 TRINITY_DN1238_c0_g1~~TRINITY_DN1238_c0_g1_i1.p1  ORF type:complete len:404 (-),score=159.12 TRINITY_DN1238_c0_g1_i1:43-1254(-)
METEHNRREEIIADIFDLNVFVEEVDLDGIVGDGNKEKEFLNIVEILLKELKGERVNEGHNGRKKNVNNNNKTKIMNDLKDLHFDVKDQKLNDKYKLDILGFLVTEIQINRLIDLKYTQSSSSSTSNTNNDQNSSLSIPDQNHFFLSSIVLSLQNFLHYLQRSNSPLSSSLQPSLPSIPPPPSSSPLTLLSFSSSLLSLLSTKLPLFFSFFSNPKNRIFPSKPQFPPQLHEINSIFIQQYQMQRNLIVKRFEVLISSLHNSKKYQTLIQNSNDDDFEANEKKLDIPQSEITRLRQCRSVDLYELESVSMDLFWESMNGTFVDTEAIVKRLVVLKTVEDRGGRTGAAQNMPLWKDRSVSSSGNNNNNNHNNSGNNNNGGRGKEQREGNRGGRRGRGRGNRNARV